MKPYKLQLDKKFKSQMMQTVTSQSNPAESESDLIRRALALYMYLHREIEKTPGMKVALVDSNNTALQIIDPLP